MKIIDTNTCNAQEAYDGVIQDTMLCAGYMEGTIDACQVSPGIIHNDHIVYYQLIFYVDLDPIFHLINLNLDKFIANKNVFMF